MKIPLIMISCLLVLSGVRSSSVDTNDDRAPFLFYANPLRTADEEIAARFAPVFYQALGDKPRSDYITNFDFDGDWRADNNWAHTDDKRFPLRGFVYYAVSETITHYFIHYAVFHPRDYKGGETKGRILSEIINEGVKRGTKYDPTGMMEEAAVAHENDMEGCLLVIDKHASNPSQEHVIFVETLHHSNFSAFLPDESKAKNFGQFSTEDRRVLLYVEPKGHGIEAYAGSEKQTAARNLLVYKFKGKAEDPEKQKGSTVGYDLLPIQTTLWAKGRGPHAKLTYGSTYDYGQIAISVVQAPGGAALRNIRVGKIGVTFLGKVGGINMARPPWGWFDKEERDQPLGRWFFDPATVIKRDFKLGETFSTTYTRLPFWAN